MPNSTIAGAAEHRAAGSRATTRRQHGEQPEDEQDRAARATTNRLLMPVRATRPTFCANAVAGNELKTGASAEPPCRPAGRRRRAAASTLVPTISPTARMSAVVSVMMTRITMVIETIAPISNVGLPNANGSGRRHDPRVADREKSALPMSSGDDRADHQPEQDRQPRQRPETFG